MGYPELQLSTAACEILTTYNWPGNVRELKNIIERAVVLSRGGKIDEEHLPHKIIFEEPQQEILPENHENNLEDCVTDLEIRMIAKALQNAEGNKAKAARNLKISERTLWYKLKKYKMGATNAEE
jgi:transcriptional regulator with PAS, ATPase and Fis domain